MPSGPGTKPVETEVPKKETPQHEGNGGGDGPDLSSLHPFIQGLVMKLPKPEDEWDIGQRIKWLQTAANIFDLIYKGEGGIKIEAAIALRSPRPTE